MITFATLQFENDKMRRSLSLIALTFLCLSAQAQENPHAKSDDGYFKHLDAAITAGTTGIGVEVSTPMSKYARLRAGFSVMPRFTANVDFSVSGGRVDAETGEWIESNFANLQSKLQSLTGLTVDNTVTMKGKPTFSNFNMLVDVMPFRNKNWHLTAGFYWGSSKVAEAENISEDMPSLMAVQMFNNIREKVVNDEPIYGNIYIDPDLGETIINYGEMGVHMGTYKNSNTPYLVKPDENCMVKAKVYVNSFKPYLGFGYGGRLSKKNDRNYVSFDCGAMFWGGTPNIVTHDGTSLTNDVDMKEGDVKKWVDIIKVFKVYPVINIKFSHRIF